MFIFCTKGGGWDLLHGSFGSAISVFSIIVWMNFSTTLSQLIIVQFQRGSCLKQWEVNHNSGKHSESQGLLPVTSDDWLSPAYLYHISNIMLTWMCWVDCWANKLRNSRGWKPLLRPFKWCIVMVSKHTGKWNSSGFCWRDCLIPVQAGICNWYIVGRNDISKVYNKICYRIS